MYLHMYMYMHMYMYVYMYIYRYVNIYIFIYIYNYIYKPVMDYCRKYYINWFKDKLASLKNSEESKLQIFTLLKGQYQYECFLDHAPFGKYIAGFRLSAHNLPIERGRYTKPKTPRNLRMCTLCHQKWGMKYMQCSNVKIMTLRVFVGSIWEGYLKFRLKLIVSNTD